MSNLDIIRALLDEIEDHEKRLETIEKRLDTTADSTAAGTTADSTAADATADSTAADAAADADYPALDAAQKRRANGLRSAAMRKLHAADVAGQITLVGTWLWLRTDKKIRAADLPKGWRFSRKRAAWYRRVND